MGDHDMLSAVAGEQAKLEPLPPEKLIERFCGDEARGLRADPGVVTKDDGTRVGTGWCGFNGTRSDDPLVAGFDDGYDFMGALQDRGWNALASKGDWPLVVYLQWRAVAGEYALVEYCEADITVWVFPNAEAMTAHHKTLRDCP
jgi:hypothetical protein